MLKDLVSSSNVHSKPSIENKLITSLLDTQDYRKPKPKSFESKIDDLLDLSEKQPASGKASTLEEKLRKSKANKKGGGRVGGEGREEGGGGGQKGGVRGSEGGEKRRGRDVEGGEGKGEGRGGGGGRRREGDEEGGKGEERVGRRDQNSYNENKKKVTKGPIACVAVKKLSSDYLKKVKALTENQDIFGCPISSVDPEAIATIFKKDNQKKEENKLPVSPSHMELSQKFKNQAKITEKYNPLDKLDVPTSRIKPEATKFDPNFSSKSSLKPIPAKKYSPLDLNPASMSAKDKDDFMDFGRPVNDSRRYEEKSKYPLLYDDKKNSIHNNSSETPRNILDIDETKRNYISGSNNPSERQKNNFYHDEKRVNYNNPPGKSKSNFSQDEKKRSSFPIGNFSSKTNKNLYGEKTDYEKMKNLLPHGKKNKFDDDYEDDFIDDDSIDPDNFDYRTVIRKMTRYDPTKYRDEDFNDAAMEVGFDQLQKEEKRSRLYGKLEDAVEMQREMRKKRKI